MGADIGRVPEDTVRSRPNGAGFPTPEHPKAPQGGGFASCDSPSDIPRNGLLITRSEPLAAQPPPPPPLPAPPHFRRVCELGTGRGRSVVTRQPGTLYYVWSLGPPLPPPNAPGGPPTASGNWRSGGLEVPRKWYCRTDVPRDPVTLSRPSTSPPHCGPTNALGGPQSPKLPRPVPSNLCPSFSGRIKVAD